MDHPYLEEMYAWVESGNTCGLVDCIFEFFDDRFHEGKFEMCDQILASLDLSRMDAQAMISTLTITFCAKDKLPSRAKLSEQIEQKLIELMGPEDAEQLMRWRR